MKIGTARPGDIEDEPDRRTIIANDLVVDVIANEDGSVYVEFYPHDSKGRLRAVVSGAFIDVYKYRTPHLKLRLTE